MDERVTRSLFQTVDALCTAIESRDPRTAGHHRCTSELSRRIAQTLLLDDDAVDGVRIGAAVHDVGMNGVPYEILVRPGILNRDEMAIVRTHVQLGASILMHVEFPWPVLDITRQHHERLDGSGYPDGLRGDQIRLESRIVAVADSVDGMMSHRPHRDPKATEFVADELMRGRGRAYDPDVVDACLAIMHEPQFATDSTWSSAIDATRVETATPEGGDIPSPEEPSPGAPDVETVVALRGSTRRFRVKAYRTLTTEEAARAVLDAVMSHRVQRPSSGEEIVVETDIGKPVATSGSDGNA